MIVRQEKCRQGKKNSFRNIQTSKDIIFPNCKSFIWFVFLRLKNLFDTIPRLECTERCQAPNAFYTGSPFLSSPIDGKLEMKELEAKEIEWQIWTNTNNVDDLKVFINQQEISNSNGYIVNGMVFTSKKQDVKFFGKFLKIKANVKIESNPNADKWTISVANGKKGDILL